MYLYKVQHTKYQTEKEEAPSLFEFTFRRIPSVSKVKDIKVLQ